MTGAAGVRPEQRHTAANPCPICSGHATMRRGEGLRCYGFTSNDGEWARCTRDEHAGELEKDSKTDAYPHKLQGDCRCGVRHDPSPAPVVNIRDPSARHRAPRASTGASWRLVKVYEIKGFNGDLAALHERYEDGQGDKKFKWRRRKGGRATLEGLRVADIPLYGSELVADWSKDAGVVLVEGEQAQEAARQAGIRALGTVTGAGSTPGPEVLKVLRDRPVILWADADDKGRAHMARIAAALQGVASSVRWFEWEDAPEVRKPSGELKPQDAADHPAIKNRDREGLASLRAELAGAPIFTPFANPTNPTNSANPANRTNRPAPISAVELMGMEFAPTRYVIADILPEGLLLLAGKPKKGKSWMALAACADVAAGGVAFGSKRVEQGSTLYLALEDNVKRLQKRLRKVLDGRPAPEGMHVEVSWPRLDEGGAELLDEWLTEHPDARLVVIDTLAKIRRPARGQNVYAEDYAALEQLLPLASKHGVAIVVVHHLRKMAASDPMDEISSSTGLTAGVDGFLILRRTPGSKGPTLYVDGRDIEEPSEYALHWNMNTATWTIEGSAEEVHISKERADILLMLNKNPGPMSPKELADVMPGAKHNNVKYLMWTMLGDGQLVKDDKGRYSPANPTNPEKAEEPDKNARSTPPVSAVSAVSGVAEEPLPDEEHDLSCTCDECEFGEV
jgi:hypothetical protein